MEKKKMVFGVGINDVNYKVVQTKYTDKIQKVLWICPFYVKWRDMLRRCYDKSYIKRNPTYNLCYVCDEWLVLSNFRKWMEARDWEGKQLDKDILIEDNKVYSPETCVFVDKKVNMFLTDRKTSRGEYPTGVYWSTQNKKFISQCSQGSGRQKYLGSFNTPEEAYQAWREEKLRQAENLAAEQTDELVAKALINRYKD